MIVEDRIQSAVRSPQASSALRALVKELVREDYDKPAIAKLFEDFIVH